MKLKNVKVGTRVELKVAHPDIPDILPKGTQGIILESDDIRPFVQWDCDKHITLHGADGMGVEGKCLSVVIECIKRVK